jgi:hypothetical protein
MRRKLMELARLQAWTLKPAVLQRASARGVGGNAIAARALVVHTREPFHGPHSLS